MKIAIAGTGYIGLFNTILLAQHNEVVELDNVENNQPVELMDYIAILERAFGKAAEKQLLYLQAGEVPDTYANLADLVEQFHYQSATTVDNGIKSFVAWYRNEYKAI